MENRILETVLAAYLEAAAFTDFGPDGEIPSDLEFSPDALESARADCESFLQSNAALSLEYVQAGRTWDSFGHDIWFTRNRHGVGFWDRGLGKLGDKLTDSAHALGVVYCYLGDDDLLYFG